MTALDPATADYVLTMPEADFSSTPFGDVLLQVFAGANAHPVESDSFGNPAIPRDSAISEVKQLSTIDGSPPPGLFSTPDEFTFMIALDGVDGQVDPDQYLNGVPWLSLVTSATQAPYIVAGSETLTVPDYPSAIPAGPCVYVLSGSVANAETFFATSAFGIAATGAANDPGTSDAPIQINASSTLKGRVLGMWLWNESSLSQTDAVDTAQAIATTLSTAPSGAGTAASEWGVVGSGSVTVSPDEADVLPVLPPAGGSVEPPASPALPTPPDYAPEPIRHIWQDLGAPSPDSSGIDPDWMPGAWGYDEYARMQVVVEGNDITYFLGAATPEPDWAETEPFGWGPATIRLPQLTVFHATPAWARNGANVLVRLVPVAGSALEDAELVYQGVVTRIGDRQDSGPFTLECTGLLYAADLQLRKPSFTTKPLDIGTAIPRTLNAIVSRRYLKMAPVVTGIRTSVAGGWEPSLTGYLANVLATAVDRGRQWTVAMDGRTPVLRRKDTTTIDWTIRTGQAGVKIDLGSDAAEGVTAVYGEGINPDGGRWRNAKYPNWRPDDTPDYPNNDPNKTHSTGARDSDTDSGSGISDWQRKAGLRVTGVLSSSDVAEMRRQQRRMGILPDGFLGPQTWAATFKTGSNTGTFDGAFIAPLAVAEEVMPRLYGPDGDDLGVNPDYDPDVLRVERKIEYGQGVWKSEGARNAREVLARDADPGHAGTVTFDRVDPETMHRFQLRAGSNGRIEGWRGEDLTVHTASVSKRGQSVTLTVDTKARDYPTLKAILERNREATDPARTARQRLLHGLVATDRPVYDAESPGGQVPRHALFGGLWNVLQIPMGDYGRIVRTEFRTTSSPTPFALAVFGKPITAATLVSVVGNPLTGTDNPWKQNHDALKDRGYMMAWGEPNQPAGYFPGQKVAAQGDTSDPLTGRLEDDASWDYVSQSSPWIWVAAFASASCFIEGRFYGGARD